MCIYLSDSARNCGLNMFLFEGFFLEKYIAKVIILPQRYLYFSNCIYFIVIPSQMLRIYTASLDTHSYKIRMDNNAARC